MNRDLSCRRQRQGWARTRCEAWGAPPLSQWISGAWGTGPEVRASFASLSAGRNSGLRALGSSVISLWGESGELLF